MTAPSLPSTNSWRMMPLALDTTSPFGSSDFMLLSTIVIIGLFRLMIVMNYERQIQDDGEFKVKGESKRYR